MNLCKTCQAPIIWTVTVKGKRMPVDAEESPDGNVQLHYAGDSIKAQVLAAHKLHIARLSGARLHLSHFVTCAQAAQHRH